MRLERLWLTDFRNYTALELEFVAGLTVIKGENGQGKTNLLEAIGYLSANRSFRGATTETLVRVGSERAVVRGEGERQQRHLLLECEIPAVGRSRTLVNRQPIKRLRDLGDAYSATVFAPDDLALIKSGPSARREFLDELLAGFDPRLDALQRELERVLRQRNTLLKQANGRLTQEISLTLDVWDVKFAQAGEQLGDAREHLIAQLQPHVDEAYSKLADKQQRVGMSMLTDWRSSDGGKGLAASLEASRTADLQRGVTTTGPHRDEVSLSINGFPSRTHASQGEQRTLALALRLGAHLLSTEVLGAPPILLLDDVFSELDPIRSRALLEEIPKSQTFLTTTDVLPTGATIEKVLEIRNGAVVR